MIKSSNKKVFVGISGGVDSSVSAALLKEQGYEVTGVFIKVWSPDFLPCNWQEERRDAMRVCATLGIPFLTFDFEKEYKQEVVDYMVREYQAGRTPNPDVMCNKYVKFGSFLKKALEMGADFVATGHYAVKKENTGKVELWESAVKNKDQSYFLWTLSQQQLSHTLFPVGHLQKPEVRKLAERFGLPVASKKDSQGLCFMGKINLKDFLSHFIKEKKGSVLSVDGKIIGKHNGAFFLTIGQRHGFTVINKTPDDKPYYIVSKDVSKNTITVSNLSEQAGRESFFRHSGEGRNPGEIKEVTLENLNWISGVPKNDKKYLARSRYRQKPEVCSLEIDENGAKIIFEKPQDFITSGQSLVIYDGEHCLGGGVIV